MMIKTIYFFKRKPGLSVEEFQRYWLKRHSELVRPIGEITCYRQCHTLVSGYSRPTPPLFDGVEEICFSLPEEVKVMEKTELGMAVIEDFGNFVDTGCLRYIITEEVEIKYGTVPEGMVKNIELVTRKKGMAVKKFHAYWRNCHGPLAAKIQQIQRYVQSHTLMNEYDKEKEPDYDGVAETWFADTASMRQSASTAEYAATRSDEKNFLTEPLAFIITKELKIL